MDELDYDMAVALIAGELASGLLAHGGINVDEVPAFVVKMARAIVAEVQRTEPQPSTAHGETR